MARKRERPKSLCPLTSDPRERERADHAVAAIKKAFPPGIAQPALRALAATGYTSLAQLADAREEELMELHGMGPKAMGILREALRAIGKTFKKE